MVDVAVVEDEDASRARIGVSEGNDELLKELKETLHIYRTWDDVVGDNTINGQDWKEGKSLPTDKKPMLDAPALCKGPAFASSRCVAIASSLINKHKHVQVGDKVGNMIHICGSEHVIPF